MSASRAFFQAIDRARRERKLAELVDVAGIDCDDDEMDDRDDEIGDELADRELRPLGEALRSLGVPIDLDDR